MLCALVVSALLSQQPPPPPRPATYPAVVVVVSRRIDVQKPEAQFIAKGLSDILVEADVEVADSPEQTLAKLDKFGGDPEKCEGKRACLADLAKKLGVTFMLSVSVAQIGSDVAVSLDAVRASDALSVFEQSFVVPSDDSGRLVRESKKLAQKMVLIAPKYVPPAPALPAYAYFTGLQVGLRGDADLLDVPAFIGAATAEYSWRYLGVAASALVAPRRLGGRLEARGYPFNFEIVRPYVAVGASALATGVAPRAGVGVQLRVGNHFRLHVDGAAERFLQSGTADIRPFALLVGGGAGWRF